jgi:hypothetical protein
MEEELAVVETDTVLQKYAVVVHVQDTAVAGVAMVCSLWLPDVAE